jgi:NitT/TauT family transport system ATP-binding protein
MQKRSCFIGVESSVRDPHGAAPGRSVKIRVDGVSKIFGGGGRGAVTALDVVNADIASEEIVCLLGPSGCGKSTLLNIIAGFDAPTTGTVSVGGRLVERPGPDRAMVFQTPALFPWLTVKANIELGVKCRGVPRSEYEENSSEYISAMGLEGFEHHYPYQLSGGMRQRVSIARALLGKPDVLLLDEPFGALDAQTRLTMQELLLQMWDRFRPTIVFVTHDVEEAVFLANRILLMSARPGRMRDEIPVPLARPRSFEVLTSDEFVAIKKDLLTRVHNQ